MWISVDVWILDLSKEESVLKVVWVGSLKIV